MYEVWKILVTHVNIMVYYIDSNPYDGIWYDINKSDSS